MQANEQGRRDAQLHGGHLALIAACAVLLVGVTFMKNGFRLTFKEPAGEKRIVKLADVQRQVALELGVTNTGLAENQQLTEQQLALLDPDSAGGQVAGATTDASSLGLPDGSDVPQEVLNGMKVKVSKQAASEASVRAYADQIIFVETAHDATGLVVAVNGEDLKAAGDSRQKLDDLISALAVIEVPAEIQDYHKLKLLYYESLIQLANIYVGDMDRAGLETVSTALLSLTDRLQTASTEIQTKYNVQL